LLLEAVFGSISQEAQDAVRFDRGSKLPLPPFQMLFTRSERAVMALIADAQLGGCGSWFKIKLADKGKWLPLPGPYQDDKITRENDFMVDYHKPEEAQYLLEMMVDETDVVPRDMLKWVSLQDL
jgi:hypothetical protein